MPIACLVMENTDPIAALFARASSHRVPMSLICLRAGMAPTTPSRWKRGKNGATLDAVSKLSSALNDIIAEQAA